VDEAALAAIGDDHGFNNSNGINDVVDDGNNTNNDDDEEEATATAATADASNEAAAAVVTLTLMDQIRELPLVDKMDAGITGAPNHLFTHCLECNHEVRTFIFQESGGNRKKKMLWGSIPFSFLLQANPGECNYIHGVCRCKNMQKICGWSLK
jgi:hypothetical protein